MSEPTSTSGVAPILVCLGSNIEPEENLRRALAELARAVELCGVSRVYRSAPVGNPLDPLFLNAAVAIATPLSPRALKHEVLRPIEHRLGRVRTPVRHAPRTIDLDLAIYGSMIFESPVMSLNLPEPGILRYAHVALPLADLAPAFEHPETGETLAAIAERLRAGAAIEVVGTL